MNTNDFVIAMRPVNGIVKNSVGVIKSASQEGVLVYFIGKDEAVRVPFSSIAVIDIDRTGKGHGNKICNICHILKRMEMFDKNQRDAQQRTGRQKVRDCHVGYGDLSFVYAYLTRPRFGCPIRSVDTAWG